MVLKGNTTSHQVCPKKKLSNTVCKKTHADKWRDQTKIEKKYRERKGSKKAFKIL
jgi:hypothetical protein